MNLSFDLFKSKIKTLTPISPMLYNAIENDERFFKFDGNIIDEISKYSIKLITSALEAKKRLLLIMPNHNLIYSAALFSSSVLMQAYTNVRTKKPSGKILYFSKSISIRSQLSKICVNGKDISDYFKQFSDRGKGEKIKDISIDSLMPTIMYISHPADPVEIIKHHNPCWIAIDLTEEYEVEWLADILKYATKINLPVIAWSDKPFSNIIMEWKEANESIIIWEHYFGSNENLTIDNLQEPINKIQIVPRIITGNLVCELSKLFIHVTKLLCGFDLNKCNRLESDAISIAWRLIRILESISIPIEVFDEKATLYPLIKSVSSIRNALEIYVNKIESISNDKASVFRSILSNLDTLYKKIKENETPPLWSALLNLCTEPGTPRAIIFSSKARMEMFSFYLLAKYNCSEDDLRKLKVELVNLSNIENVDLDKQILPIFVGIPSHYSSVRLDVLLQNKRIEFLIWPHNNYFLGKRFKEMDHNLVLSQFNINTWFDSEKIVEQDITQYKPKYFDFLSPILLDTDAVIGKTVAAIDELILWKPPQLDSVIDNLFNKKIEQVDIQAETEETATVIESDDNQVKSHDLIVNEVIELTLENNHKILLGQNDLVNVVINKDGKVDTDKRYVLAIKPNDVLLFINGSSRATMYDLIISKIHKHRNMAQYISLVQKWQNDISFAFQEKNKIEKVQLDDILKQIQDKGSKIISTGEVKWWIEKKVLAPYDPEDLRRIAEVFDLDFVKKYYMNISRAARALQGIHQSLSRRLNNYLLSDEIYDAAKGDKEIINKELNLTLEDFRHSMLKLRVLKIDKMTGIFYTANLGKVEKIHNV